MAWEYLENMDYRYKEVSEFINENDFVADFNSGNSRFKEYIKCKTYLCNDLYDDRATHQVSDEKFYELLKDLHNNNAKIDVISCFGIGGYEMSKEELESKTITSSLIKSINLFKPRIVIIEGVTKFYPIIKKIIGEINYQIICKVNNSDGNNWKKDRTIVVLKNGK